MQYIKKSLISSQLYKEPIFDNYLYPHYNDVGQFDKGHLCIRLPLNVRNNDRMLVLVVKCNWY